MAEPYLICPRSWIETTLEPSPEAGFIAQVNSGGTPSTLNEDYWDGRIPWLTPKDVTALEDEIFISRTERTVSQSGVDSSGAKLLPAGTVLLTKRAPVGLVAINAVPMATNQGFLNFQCGPKLRPLFLAYWLEASRPYLELVANGSTYPELYKGDLFEFHLSVPPIEEQDSILGAMSSLEYVIALGRGLQQSAVSAEEIVRVQTETETLRQIRDSLLPLLISGQLQATGVGQHFSQAAR
jgi:restriction endonuclease S subunit